MNGISKYHSGIIETGNFTIEDVSGIQWYSRINGNEWYFQIPFGVSLRLASVPLRTSVVLNAWYSIVMNGISKYHSGYH